MMIGHTHSVMVFPFTGLVYLFNHAAKQVVLQNPAVLEHELSCRVHEQNKRVWKTIGYRVIEKYDG